MSHISKELISKAAEFFRVVGDETRMKILCTIAGGELCVNDIAAEVEMTKSAVSHQLRLLKSEGLVKSMSSISSTSLSSTSSTRCTVPAAAAHIATLPTTRTAATNASAAMPTRP